MKIFRKYFNQCPPYLSIVGLYLLVGMLWIYFSDSLLESVISAEALTEYQTLKGFLFILVTSGLLYMLMARQFKALDRAHRALKESYDLTLSGWMKALEIHHGETTDHTTRVTDMAVRLAQAMGMKGEAIERIKRGSIIHDLGKLGIPESILTKPGPLTVEEWEIIRRHPAAAKAFLQTIPSLRSAEDIPYCHHERWDGNGYPQGLKEQEIPLAARIFAVVDVWDALISERVYKRAWTPEEAREYLFSQSGIQFDPKVIRAFFHMLDTNPDLETEEGTMHLEIDHS